MIRKYNKIDRSSGLFMYTHDSWANGVSEHTGSLSPQEAQVWQTPAPKTSEGQS
jgi:hypothetical protein